MVATTDTSEYAPSKGCLGCPHRGTCHPTRKRIHDLALDTGRHYQCPFYRGITEKLRARSGIAMLPDWLRRIRLPWEDTR